jgi:glycosyltransferase involved in cell wall biosynthesis
MKRKIRVAVLIDAWFPSIGGAQIHVRELMKRLRSSCNFTLYHAPSSNIIIRFIWSFMVVLQVLWENQSRQFDIIHAHAFIAGFPAKILSLLTGIPVIFTVHGSHTLDLVELKRSHPNLKIATPLWKEILERWLLTGIRYDRLITVSESFLRYKNINRDYVVIPNGVNVGEFDAVNVRKNEDFTILFVGKTAPIKGLTYLNRAVKRVRKRYPLIRIKTIVGEISERERIIRAYKSSHVFVLPSLAEGQPIALLEAWAAKLPVIVTSVGDNEKMVKDGLNGYLVPPADIQALSKAIVTTYTNPNLAKLGEAGYNLVKKNYPWQNAAKQTLKVYQEVCYVTR